MTRSADTRLGVLLVVLVLGLNVLAVSSRLGFLHKPNQVKEYDHRRYIEMAKRGRGPPGAPEGAALLLPPRRSRPRAGALPSRAVGERRLLPGHERRSLRLPARALAPPAGPRLRLVPARDRPPGRRPDAGGRAVVRVPVLDERPRRALPGDAGLLPRRAREGGRAPGREPPRGVRARDLRPRLPVRLPARAAHRPAASPGRRAHGRPGRAAVRDPGRHPPPRHAEPARRLRLRHRGQHDVPLPTTCSTTSSTW